MNNTEMTILNELPRITQLLQEVVKELKEQRKILTEIEKWNGR